MIPPHLPTKVEIHCPIEHFAHPVSVVTDRIMNLCPKLILGSSYLLDYDRDKHSITLQKSFHELLKLLVNINELDPKVLEAKTIFELNDVLQKAQGPKGGMLRKPNTERWEMKDAPILVDHYPAIENLLERLGFSTMREVTGTLTVNHCVLFGATVKCMEKRILNTIHYLLTQVKVTDSIILASSQRKLLPEELKAIREKLLSLDDSQEKNYWNEVFDNPKEAHEANAFVFLWKYLAPIDLQSVKIIPIKATRIGSSFHVNSGCRPTTEITVEDLTAFYQDGQYQSYFALAEQPYIRLSDQLRMTVLSNKKEAPFQTLIERINRTVFYSVHPGISPACLKTVIFDEIGRHVFRTCETLQYFERIEQN